LIITIKSYVYGSVNLSLSSTALFTRYSFFDESTGLEDYITNYNVGDLININGCDIDIYNGYQTITHIYNNTIQTDKSFSIYTHAQRHVKYLLTLSSVIAYTWAHWSYIFNIWYYLYFRIIDGSIGSIRDINITNYPITLNDDTLGQFNTSNGELTISQSGTYNIKFNVNVDISFYINAIWDIYYTNGLLSGYIKIGIYKNGVRIGVGTKVGPFWCGGTNIPLANSPQSGNYANQGLNINLNNISLLVDDVIVFKTIIEVDDGSVIHMATSASAIPQPTYQHTINSGSIELTSVGIIANEQFVTGTTIFNLNIPDTRSGLTSRSIKNDIDSTTGMTNFGISMYNQNLIYNISDTNNNLEFLPFNNSTLFTSLDSKGYGLSIYENKSLIYLYNSSVPSTPSGDISTNNWYRSDVSWKRNFSDMVLFNNYHLWKNNEISNYSLGFFMRSYVNGAYEYLDPAGYYIYSILQDFNENVDIRKNIYENRLTTIDQNNFEKWNRYTQTTTQNFNQKVAIQLVSRNLASDENGYRDYWYGGQFYNGTFGGKWNGGDWGHAKWLGWNSLIIPSGSSSYHAPNYYIGSVSIIENKNYVTNYDFLRQQKLYYDIAPWYNANKKNTETVNLPLRKKERKF